MADLEYRVENGVGTILLNRPEKKNAFTLEMLHRWAEIYREARTDDDVGAIVLTGAGDAFCSGGDLGGLAPGEPTPYDRKAFLTDHVHRVIYALEELDKPVIAAVNGAAVGPPLVTRMIKRTVYQSVRSDLRTSLDLVSSHMAIAQSTEDSKEALSAFLEKREPKFRGR